MFIKKTRWRPSSRGFSLLELLLVMALLPIVFFAVFSNFSTGLKIWTRVVQATPEEDLNIFHTKIRRDLENMRYFSPAPLEGDKEEISFASTVSAPPELGGERGIGQVRIYYDEGKNIIFKDTRNYSEMYREKDGTQTALLQNVTSFELAYFYKDPQGSGYFWSDSWKPDPKKMPTAVKISFSIAGVPEKQEDVVFIPVGGSLK